MIPVSRYETLVSRYEIPVSSYKDSDSKITMPTSRYRYQRVLNDL